MTILSPNPEAQGRFGRAVAIADDVAYVGAPGEQRGVDQENAGAGYVFRRDFPTPDEWELRNCIGAADPNPLGSEQFGASFDMSTPAVVIGGALFDHSSGATAGSAFIFFGAPCDADVNLDGAVTVTDLVSVITHWNCTGDRCTCPDDVTADGVVNVQDLVQVIVNWGDCVAQPITAEFNQCVQQCGQTNPNCVIRCADFYGYFD